LVNSGLVAGTTSTYTTTASTNCVINGRFATVLTAQTNTASPTLDAVTGLAFVPVLANQASVLLWGVTRLLAKRLRIMDETLADSVFLDVTGRTAKRLLDLSDGADEFTLPVTQEELAGMVGASRERVNKAIASFIRLGWLEQHERHYRIIKRQSLDIRAR
jgi:CRP-like cAMP-binding protein